jgi:hypothetical protein
MRAMRTSKNHAVYKSPARYFNPASQATVTTEGTGSDPAFARARSAAASISFICIIRAYPIDKYKLQEHILIRSEMQVNVPANEAGVV